MISMNSDPIPSYNERLTWHGYAVELCVHKVKAGMPGGEGHLEHGVALVLDVVGDNLLAVHHQDLKVTVSGRARVHWGETERKITKEMER